MTESGENLPTPKPDIPISDGNNLPMRTERPSIDGVLPIEQNTVDRAVSRARQELRPNAGGAPWLYLHPSELDSINSPQLRRMVEVLESTPAPLLTEDVLRARYLRIQDWIIDGSVNPGDAQEYLVKISQRIEDAVGGVKIENPESPENHVMGILGALNTLERKANLEQKTFEDFAKEVAQIKEAIERIPKEVSERPEFYSPELSTPQKKVYLKEKLELVFDSRRRLHDRKVEIVAAAGNLQRMGVGEQLPLAKGMAIAFTDISPTNWYVLVHHDELFSREVPGADREINVPVADALALWQEVGENWGQVVTPGVPTFDKTTINSDEAMKRLRDAIAGKVGVKAEQIAYDLFTVSLTFDRWDKYREKLTGSNDPRDLMHFEQKRREDFYEKPRAAGPEDTIGAYFSKLHQGEEGLGVNENNPDYDKKPAGDLKREQLKTLENNSKRSVFKYSLNGTARGQIVGDLWEVADAKMSPDSDAPRTPLIEIIHDQRYGWKKVPFQQLPDEFYKSYFGYYLSYADRIQKELVNVAWDPKETLTPKFWRDRDNSLSRLGIFSPYLISLPKNEKLLKTAEIKRVFALGVIWTYSDRVQPQKGLLGKIFSPRRGLLTWGDIQTIFRSIETSGFLPTNDLRRLRKEVAEYRFLSQRLERG